MDIYLGIDFLDKRKFTSSGLSNYVGKSVKGLAAYITLRTRRSSNKKQKSSTSNIDFFPQYFMNILEEFKGMPYLGYRKVQVKNDPTEAYILLVKKIQLIKNN